MMAFAALVLAAVLSKVLGNQVFTPLSVGIAASLFLLRHVLDLPRRRAVERFLLQFGVLLYALANQDPSYYEHTALALCLVPTLARWRRIAETALAESSVLMVLLFILWSAVWTANREMSTAGFVMSALCLAFVIAFVLQAEGDLPLMYRGVLLVLGAILVGSLIAGGMGHGSAGKTFAGVTLHRNQLGFLLGLMILLCLFALRWRHAGPLPWWHLAGGIAATALLIFIDSKSAIIAIAFTALVLFVVSARRWKLYLGALALGMVVFVAALPSPKMDHFALWMGRDPTFTSRTEIWEDSLRLAAHQPFTGYGYNAVWSAHENRLAQYRNAPGPLYAHAHNAWIDWVLQLGVGGLAVYLLFLGVLLKRALDLGARPAGLPLAIQAACLLLYIQIYDLANVSTVPVTRFGFFMLAVTTLGLWCTGAAPAPRRQAFAALAGPAGDGDAFGTSRSARASRGRRLGLAALLLAAGFVGMTAYALWEDGRRFAAAEPRPAPAPNGMAQAGYLDAREFQWKTPEKLQDYVHRHRQALQQMMERSEAP